MAVSFVPPDLIKQIRSQFRLDWHGVHGAPHWARVHRHGVYLAPRMGADIRVVELFAFLHDSQRENDYTDPGHGERAADYAQWLRQRRMFELEASAMELLQRACRGHSNGGTVEDVTVQVCWDADRLDLGRVGKRPDSRYLCTHAAQDPAYLAKALQWSQGAPIKLGSQPIREVPGLSDTSR